jgi:hypothetical protein
MAALKWKREELVEADRTTRAILQEYGAHSTMGVNASLYIDRRRGGRGLCGVELTYDATRIKLAARMVTARDATVRDYQRACKHASWFATTVNAARGIGLTMCLDDGAVSMSYDRDGKTVGVDVSNEGEVARIVHEMQQRKLEAELRAHQWHGKYARCLHEESERVSPFTHRILMWDGMSYETERALFALRERWWSTRAYCVRVLHQNGSAKCRHCQAEDETVEHALGGCQVLAATAYTKRHNAALKCLVWWLLHRYGVHDQLRAWSDERTPEAVTENGRIKVWWDVPVESVHTGRALRNNRPDLRVLLKREKRLVVVEMACPLDANVPVKFAEKSAKYGDVLQELKSQFAEEAASVEYVALVVGALGRIDKGTLLEGLRVVMGARAGGGAVAVEPAAGGPSTTPLEEVERVAERMQKAVVTGSVNIAKAYFRHAAARRG